MTTSYQPRHGASDDDENRWTTPAVPAQRSAPPMLPERPRWTAPAGLSTPSEWVTPVDPTHRVPPRPGATALPASAIEAMMRTAAAPISPAVGADPSSSGSAPSAPGPRPRRAWVPWTVAGVACVVAIGAIASGGRTRIPE
ncbi:hypothetical protein WIS52_25085 [Pseudonocardia nematodicida]|uniref:Serine protease n=1 Tax=Pseudonocardia nematodicida TaxID=1206997 RepID=A0ABV1KJI4_9PSEU